MRFNTPIASQTFKTSQKKPTSLTLSSYYFTGLNTLAADHPIKDSSMIQKTEKDGTTMFQKMEKEVEIPKASPSKAFTLAATVPTTDAAKVFKEHNDHILIDSIDNDNDDEKKSVVSNDFKNAETMKKVIGNDIKPIIVGRLPQQRAATMTTSSPPPALPMRMVGISSKFEKLEIETKLTDSFDDDDDDDEVQEEVIEEISESSSSSTDDESGHNPTGTKSFEFVKPTMVKTKHIVPLKEEVKEKAAETKTTGTGPTKTVVRTFTKAKVYEHTDQKKETVRLVRPSIVRHIYGRRGRMSVSERTKLVEQMDMEAQQRAKDPYGLARFRKTWQRPHPRSTLPSTAWKRTIKGGNPPPKKTLAELP